MREMIPLAVAHGLLLGIVLISLALMLVRPGNIPEVYWVGGGAGLLVLLRLVSPGLALKAVAKGSNVYLFLIGMMLLSAVAEENGVFDWLSSAAIRLARGSGERLFLLIYGLGTLVTICMSNDATAVVLTPAILVAVRKARVAPLPYLFACALVANAASFVLPISNPANLVVFRQGMPTLGQWLLRFGVPSVLSIGVTYGVLRLYFRTQLRTPLQDSEAAPSEALQPAGRVVVVGIVLVVAVLLVASAVGIDLGIPACVAALLLTIILWLRARGSFIEPFRSISWATLLLVAGLFVLVDAVESIGALHVTGRWLHAAGQLRPAAGALLVSFVVAVGNNLVNNLPLGLLAAATLHAAPPPRLLADAVLIGVDLGPNLSITGSLATILWLLALRKEGLNVGFWDFLRVGAVLMPVALAAAMGGAILIHGLFGR